MVTASHPDVRLEYLITSTLQPVLLFKVQPVCQPHQVMVQYVEAVTCYLLIILCSMYWLLLYLKASSIMPNLRLYSARVALQTYSFSLQVSPVPSL